MERQQVAKVLDKVGVVGDEAVLDTLQLILDQEKANIHASADNIVAAVKASDSKVSQHDAAVLALAIKQNRFHSAPSRQARLDTARIENAKEIAWPLGPLVRVPLDQAVAHRADVVLRASDPAPPFVVDQQSGAAARSHHLSGPPVQGLNIFATVKAAGDKAGGKGAAARVARRGQAAEGFVDD